MNTAELIALALTQDPESHDYWDTVWELQKRSERETFDAACELCGGDDDRQRMLGADILAQLGAGEKPPGRPFRDEAVPLLLEMLADSRNAATGLLTSLIGALGHQDDPRTVAPIVQFKNHPDNEVRWYVATSLGGHEDELAVATLIELSRDENSAVRDWATFGLGTQSEADTPAIRDALAKRLTDEDDDTRNEAIRGLAERKDERAIAPIIGELENGNPGSLAIESAVAMADSRLLPALLKLKAADLASGLDDEDLDEAIALCRVAP